MALQRCCPSRACGGCSRLIPSEDEHMATAAGPAGAPACLCLQNAGVLQGTECWQGLAFGGKGEEWSCWLGSSIAWLLIAVWSPPCCAVCADLCRAEGRRCSQCSVVLTLVSLELPVSSAGAAPAPCPVPFGRGIPCNHGPRLQCCCGSPAAH